MEGAADVVQWLDGRTPEEQTLACAVLFVCVHGVSHGILALLPLKRVRALSGGVRGKLAGAVASQVHALVVISAAVVCVLNKANDAQLRLDRVRGTTTLSERVVVFSTGYFLYDIFVVLLLSPPIDFKFLLHAVVCFMSFYFAQAPFFQYYLVRFLLFEVSTPFLNMSNMAGFLQWSVADRAGLHRLFGLSFVGCRILYGLPLAYEFVSFMLELIRDYDRKSTSSSSSSSDPADLPPLAVLYFAVFACSSMAALNVVWAVVGILGQGEGGEGGEGGETANATAKAKKKDA